MRVSIDFAGVPMKRRLKKRELLDGPLFDRNIGKPVP
jgi:hypothetical protein